MRLALGHHRFSYRPGQSVQVALHGEPLPRHYSLADAPAYARANRSLELLVKDAPEGSAQPYLQALERGTLIDVEGPIGSFVYPRRRPQQDSLFVAGGTGIAPVRAMIRHALRQKDGGRLSLLYSAKTPREFAFGQELQQLARAGALHLMQTVTQEADESWTGARGRISAQRLKPLVHTPSTLCFICGPPAFLDAISAALTELDIAPSHILTENW